MVIDNGDSPPLDMRSLKVFGEKPRLLVDLKPGAYKLWYGNPLALPPQYDLTRFSPLLAWSHLPVAALGPEQVNPDYNPPRTPWLINLIVLVTAAVLAAMIVRNLRGLGK